MIGSAVYMKRWRPEARRLLKRHAKELADRPFWVFSSGPFGEKPDPSWSEPPRTIERAEHLGVRDHVVFGGRLPLEPSNFMERAMVRDCPPDKRDLRDWDEIRAWAAGIGTELSLAGPPLRVVSPVASSSTAPRESQQLDLGHLCNIGSALASSTGSPGLTPRVRPGRVQRRSR